MATWPFLSASIKTDHVLFPDEDRLSKRKSIGDNISLPPEDESRNSPEKEEVNSFAHSHTQKQLLHLIQKAVLRTSLLS